MNKILIHMEGGVIQWIGSTDKSIEILIVDLDAIDEGENPVREPVNPDFHFKQGEAYTLFPEADDDITFDLKRLKF